MKIITSIQNRIYELRGERVMLDFDLAELYQVETRILNQAVKRNIERFPKDFMFRLTVSEWQELRSLAVAASNSSRMRSQIVIAYQNKRNATVTPFAFTEQGVAMLSGVLNSEKAIKMNIAIMRAFIKIRKTLLAPDDFRKQLQQIKERLSEHDIQLSQIYEAMENLLDETAAQRKWNNRERIGFKK